MDIYAYVQKYGMTAFNISKGYVNSRKYLVIYYDEIAFTDEIKPYHGKYVYDRKDVNRLVYSHQLIEKFDDLEHAKSVLSTMDADILFQTYSIQKNQLEAAIKDVEACTRRKVAKS